MISSWVPEVSVHGGSNAWQSWCWPPGTRSPDVVFMETDTHMEGEGSREEEERREDSGII